MFLSDTLKFRLVFSRFFDFQGTLGNHFSSRPLTEEI